MSTTSLCSGIRESQLSTQKKRLPTLSNTGQLKSRYCHLKVGSVFNERASFLAASREPAHDEPLEICRERGTPHTTFLHTNLGTEQHCQAASHPNRQPSPVLLFLLVLFRAWERMVRAAGAVAAIAGLPLAVATGNDDGFRVYAPAIGVSAIAKRCGIIGWRWVPRVVAVPWWMCR